MSHFLSSDLSIKNDGLGRLVFFESIRLKAVHTIGLIILALIANYFLHQVFINSQWYETWQFQVLAIFCSISAIFIWLEGSVVFDEMMQVVTIKRYFTKVFPARKVYYSDIKAVVLKRYASEDEDGHITNEGFFHLELNNGNSFLLLVFKHKDSIENARKELVRHSKLNIQSF